MWGNHTLWEGSPHDLLFVQNKSFFDLYPDVFVTGFSHTGHEARVSGTTDFQPYWTSTLVVFFHPGRIHLSEKGCYTCTILDLREIQLPSPIAIHVNCPISSVQKQLQKKKKNSGELKFIHLKVAKFELHYLIPTDLLKIRYGLVRILSACIQTLFFFLKKGFSFFNPSLIKPSLYPKPISRLSYFWWAQLRG